MLASFRDEDQPLFSISGSRSKTGGTTEKEQIMSRQMKASHSSHLIDSNLLLKELLATTL